MERRYYTNHLRGLIIDAINTSAQGHIGMGLGAAPIFYSLFGHTANFTPIDPKWINRDRIILSAGHGAIGMYGIYHFMGLLSLHEMQNHKKAGSKTPSHPEIDKLEYVDASTGPLGQGVAMGVGMCLSQIYLQTLFNKPDFQDLINHHVYVVCGDGDFQEGVCLEALQLAGTMKLNKLVLIHDYNQMQIDSSSQTVNDLNFVEYFKGLNFNTIILEDDDEANILKALLKAQTSARPTYIQVPTTIAYGTDVANLPKGHNGILSPEKTIEFKTKLGLKNLTPYNCQPEVYDHFQKALQQKNHQYFIWKQRFLDYAKQYPKEAQKLETLLNHQIPYLKFDLDFDKQNDSIRNHLDKINKFLNEKTWNLLGGSADLSAATKISFNKSILEKGRNIQYGIREFAMTAINNGIHLHSGLKTISSTFLVFADYAKSAIRLGCLMEIPNLLVYTHDSYAVGGDGPTHQPIEQLTMLRAIPGLTVLRPASHYELTLSFEKAYNDFKNSYAIIACRQNINSRQYPAYLNSKFEPAYFANANFDQNELNKVDLLLLASGSEVDLAFKVKEKVTNLNIEVVSVPCLQDLVNNPALIYKLNIHDKAVFAIEASNDPLWYKLATYTIFDCFMASDYGYSADGDEVYATKGFNVENISKKLLEFWKRVY